MDADLAAFLTVAGYPVSETVAVGRGHEGTCTVLQVQHGVSGRRTIAVKRFDTSREGASLNARAEFAALTVLHAALEHAALGARAPEPLQLLPEEVGTGYVMEAVEAGPLANALGSDAEHTAIVLSSALRAFHARMRAPYGDFHADNVLIDGMGTFWLIDPGTPGTAHRQIEQAAEQLLTHLPELDRLAAIDVGYWLYSVASRGWKRSLVAPRRTLRQWWLAERLVEAANRDAFPGFRAACFLVARQHAGRLAARSGARARVVGYLTLGLLAVRGPRR